MELPEVSEAEIDGASFSVSGPAEYTVSFGAPCKIAANVRLDALMFRWPRVFAKALVAVYKCGEFWPHFDVRTRAFYIGRSIYVLVDSASRHNESDSELVPLERGPMWSYLAKIGSAALCKTLREVLNIEGSCRAYEKLQA
ncbi:MAG: hypothetical protein TU35_005775 [Thermoproteus sp. AZ2]|uniref:Uncharacterized protein n=1 Tax=Thermoproteus sp. AZ2 TaxID=1609232 RepID=A0ACC6V158_9CREN|nr:MAG: hypothetical protein TU35_02360 [Thermoproteus sp. AZ2]